MTSIGKNRAALLLVALVTATVLPACGGKSSSSGSSGSSGEQTRSTLAGGSDEGGANVSIVAAGATWEFEPKSIEVATGSEITWKNASEAPHNVVFDDDALPASKIFNKNETHKVTLSKGGTFGYKCSIHPTMKGEVIVK